MNEELRAELEQMREEDQAVRKEAWGVVQQHGLASPEYEALKKRGQEIDRRHIARLSEIVEEHGWPGRSLVGEAACDGAFLVLQHADLATQKEYLPVLREAELWPIEDEAHVDERRASVGLEPLASYLERVGLGHLRPSDTDE